MSGTVPYDAIKSRLVSEFGATYPVRDWEEIETQLQQGADPFLAVDDNAAQTRLESVGTPQANWTRDLGNVIVHIFIPSTASLSGARTIGGLIRTSMQYYRFTVPSGETLRCLTASPPSPGVYFDGLWHSMLVTLDYEHRYAVATATP